MAPGSPSQGHEDTVRPRPEIGSGDELHREQHQAGAGPLGERRPVSRGDPFGDEREASAAAMRRLGNWLARLVVAQVRMAWRFESSPAHPASQALRRCSGLLIRRARFDSLVRHQGVSSVQWSGRPPVELGLSVGVTSLHEPRPKGSSEVLPSAPRRSAWGIRILVRSALCRGGCWWPIRIFTPGRASSILVHGSMQM